MTTMEGIDRSISQDTNDAKTSKRLTYSHTTHHNTGAKLAAARARQGRRLCVFPLTAPSRRNSLGDSRRKGEDVHPS